MNEPRAAVPPAEAIINGLRYSTANAVCLAQSHVLLKSYTSLMKTPKGAFFLVDKHFEILPVRAGIRAISKADAKAVFADYPHRYASWADAFDEELKDA